MAEEIKKEVYDRLTGKVSKKVAKYRDPDENTTRNRCGECSYYQSRGQPSGPCSRVAGTVEAQGVCNIFARAVSNGTAKEKK